MKIKYTETSQFKRDFKKLLKKFPSLKDDFKINKQYRIELFHCQELDSNSIFEIEGASNIDGLRFYKLKKFQCKSLKGRGAKSGIRVIYAFIPSDQKIIFLEIYFKADQYNEKRERISNFYNQLINIESN